MSSRTFRAVLCMVIGIGIVLTIAHLAYAVYAYQHCSIIYFIAKELWG